MVLGGEVRVRARIWVRVRVCIGQDSIRDVARVRVRSRVGVSLVHGFWGGPFSKHRQALALGWGPG